MKSKKILALSIAAVLMAGTLTACSSKANSNSQSKDSTKVSERKPYNVLIMMPGNAKAEDCKLVSEAASKITKEKFNTTVEIVRVGFGSYNQQINLALSSGEKLDLFYTNRDPFNSAVNNGQVVALNDILKTNGKDLLKNISEADLRCTSVNGKIYAIPGNKEKAVSWGFAMVKDMADATGIDYSKIKSELELEPLLQAVKQKYPGVYPVSSSNGGMSIMTTNDDLGGDFGSLKDCTNPKDTKVINWYETNEYKEIVNRRYDWVKRGLIMPDAATNTEGDEAIIGGGKAFGRFLNVKPGIAAEMEKKTSKKMVVLNFTDTYTTTSRLDILWSMAVNSEKPERAMEILNEMYINPDLENILINGVEGKHFQVIDKEKGIVNYPEGVNASNSGYPSYCWAWPNEMISYVWKGNAADIWQQTAEYNKKAIISPAKGFAWNNSEVLNEIAACNNVRSKYAIALETGSINPAEILPKFIKELKSAGVDKIITEKQKQLDLWLSKNK